MPERPVDYKMVRRDITENFNQNKYCYLIFIAPIFGECTWICYYEEFLMLFYVQKSTRQIKYHSLNNVNDQDMMLDNDDSWIVRFV